MMSNNIVKYFIQTQQLFGNTLYLNNSLIPGTSLIKYGNIKSDILFIKKATSDYNLIKKEKDLFRKILEALKLSKNDILLIEFFKIKKETSFESFINKNKLKIIVAFGSFISQFLLRTDKSLDLLRKTDNKYNGIKVIPTYSLIDMIDKPVFKKSVWNDLKTILV